MNELLQAETEHEDFIFLCGLQQKPNFVLPPGILVFEADSLHLLSLIQIKKAARLDQSVAAKIPPF